MKINSTASSALEARISSQINQTINLGEWIFGKIEVNSNDDVLELCCGTGGQTVYLSERIKDGELSCVDINPESLELNKSRTKNEKIKYIQSELDDRNRYATGTYDLVFSAYGFYYSKAPNELFEKLLTKLNQNGRFVLVGPVLGNNKELYEIVRNIGVLLPDDVVFSSEQFMLDFLQKFLLNFSGVSFERVVNIISYSSHDALLDYWKNTTFYKPGIDQEFLSESKKYFDKDPYVSKSIALLEGRI